MTRIDIVQRGTPTDPRLASGRALQQPRVVSAHTRGYLRVVSGLVLTRDYLRVFLAQRCDMREETGGTYF